VRRRRAQGRPVLVRVPNEQAPLFFVPALSRGGSPHSVTTSDERRRSESGVLRSVLPARGCELIVARRLTRAEARAA